MTNLERYRLLSQPYISHKEIMAVTGFRANKVCELVSAVISEAKQQGKTLLYERGRVPSKSVIKRLDIDMDELFEFATKEKELGIG